MTDRITTHPNIHFGKPCVSGTRITVENVLELVREGLSYEVIRKDFYLALSNDDIRACVQYLHHPSAAYLPLRKNAF